MRLSPRLPQRSVEWQGPDPGPGPDVGPGPGLAPGQGPVPGPGLAPAQGPGSGPGPQFWTQRVLGVTHRIEVNVCVNFYE